MLRFRDSWDIIMWQEGLMEFFLKELEELQGLEIYSNALEGERVVYVASTEEGARQLSGNPWGIFLEYVESVERHFENDPCQIVQVPNLPMPVSKLAFPFQKGFTRGVSFVHFFPLRQSIFRGNIQRDLQRHRERLFGRPRIQERADRRGEIALDSRDVQGVRVQGIEQRDEHAFGIPKRRLSLLGHGLDGRLRVN